MTSRLGLAVRVRINFGMALRNMPALMQALAFNMKRLVVISDAQVA